MAVKFDKDMLIKHRFWLLLAATIPMVLAAIFVLITSVSAEIDAQRKNVEQTEKTLGSVSQVVGPKENDDLKEHAKKHKESETVVHQKAFVAQEIIMSWPKAVEDKFNFRNGLFAIEIKVLDGASKPKDAEWPADDEHLLHGNVTEREEHYMTVTDKDGKEATFYQTALLKVLKNDRKENEGESRFGDIIIGNFVAITYYKSKYFYDEFTHLEQFEYSRSYLSQIHPILKIVDPVDEKGNGVVQLKGWLYNPNDMPPNRSFLTFVDKDWDTNAPIYAEAWLAQEDLWIQKELYSLVRAANDSAAKCTYGLPDKAKPPVYINPKPEDKSKVHVFANPNFEFAFQWAGDSKLNVTVKNRHIRRQKLDLQLRIKFNKSPNTVVSTETIPIAGEPLDPADPTGRGTDTRKLEIPLDQTGIQRTGIYEVEQMLTWETAPVKRLDQIAIGSVMPEMMAHGHRTMLEGSKPYRKEEVAVDDPAAAAGALQGMPPGMGPMGGDRGINPFGMGQQVLANFGPNGVLKDRYIEVSEQARRVPVGISLIVDQDNVDRVLTAFNNSKLRFLITQVLVNRYPNSVRPQLFGQGQFDAQPGADAPPMLPMAPPGAFPGKFGAPPGVRGDGDFPMGGFPMMGPGMGLTSSEEMENNVELVIYGIATLYERYPKRKIQVGEVKDAK
jgi:hypothetical protein